MLMNNIQKYCDIAYLLPTPGRSLPVKLPNALFNGNFVAIEFKNDVADVKIFSISFIKNPLAVSSFVTPENTYIGLNNSLYNLKKISF